LHQQRVHLVGKVVSKDIETSLAEYATVEGRVIVFAQTGKFSLFGRNYGISAPPEPWLTPFSFAPPNELMKSFKVGLLGTELLSLYPRHVLTELPEDHEALVCVAVAAQPRKFMGVSLARKRIGRGDLVLCQFDLNDRSNPSALLMLRNLLAERETS